MVNNILILTSGKVSKINDFPSNVDKASFDDVGYDQYGRLFIENRELKNYKLIYFRMVGKSLEPATLVADYAIKNGVRLVDKIYENSHLMPLSLGKSIEIKKLIESGVPMPKTEFNRFDRISYPFLVKSTNSSRGREVFLVRNKNDFPPKLNGKFYIAQEFIPNTHRIRALVVGNKVIGAIERQTKWNKDNTKKTLDPIPEDIEKMAIFATRSVGLDICGVDILINPQGEKWVIETNAAPSWKLINKYCNVVVENEITKYLQNQIQ